MNRRYPSNVTALDCFVTGKDIRDASEALSTLDIFIVRDGDRVVGVIDFVKGVAEH